MSDKVYASAAGHVQFDPRQRDVNGKLVTDVAIKSVSGQKLVNITIWPEFQLSVPVKKGDFISADGTFETRTYQADDGSTKESLSISPTSLVHVPCVPKAERTVVQASPVAVAATPVVQAAPATTVPF